MNDQNSALNDSGDSPAPASSEDGDTVSTMITPQSGASKSDSDKSDDPDAKDAKDASDKAKGGEGGKDDEGDRFDKHPRFIELNNRTKAAETGAALAEARAANLAQEVASLKATQAASKTSTGEELPYKDLTKMSPDEVRDWIDTDPIEYTNNLVSMLRHELKGEVHTDLETDRMDRLVEGTFTSFAKDNPEFDPMWDSGKLKQFMDANPGHNAISAFVVMTLDERLAAAKAEGAKEAKEELQKDLETKRSSQVLGDGPGSGGRPVMDEDADLGDTKASGGLISTLTKRSLARDANAR